MRFTLDLDNGDVQTVLVGLSISLGAPVLDDDPTAPTAGQSRMRIYGLGGGDLSDVEYCVDGQPISGGSRPRTDFTERSPGAFNLEVRIADGSCSGALRDTLSLTLEADRVYSLFLAPGTELGPSRGVDDVYYVFCTDSIDGEVQTPSSCDSGYATEAP